MKRTVFLTVLLLVLAAAVAAASTPSVVWFADNFNSYVNNTRLRLVTPSGTPWATNAIPAGGPLSSGPENYVLNNYSYEGTGLAVRLKGSSGTGAPSFTYTNLDFASLSVSALVQLHVRIMPDPAYGNNYTVDHGGVYMVDAAGNVIAGWVGSCARMKNKWTMGGGEGVQINFTDNLWHDFDITYDPATGWTNWYRDGLLHQSVQLTAGLVVDEILVHDSAAVENNYLWLDDLAIGTVPEPGSLLILGMGLIGLAARRRRC